MVFKKKLLFITILIFSILAATTFAQKDKTSTEDQLKKSKKSLDRWKFWTLLLSILFCTHGFGWLTLIFMRGFCPYNVSTLNNAKMNKRNCFRRCTENPFGSEVEGLNFWFMFIIIPTFLVIRIIYERFKLSKDSEVKVTHWKNRSMILSHDKAQLQREAWESQYKLNEDMKNGKIQQNDIFLGDQSVEISKDESAQDPVQMIPEPSTIFQQPTTYKANIIMESEEKGLKAEEVDVMDSMKTDRPLNQHDDENLLDMSIPDDEDEMDRNQNMNKFYSTPEKKNQFMNFGR